MPDRLLPPEPEILPPVKSVRLWKWSVSQRAAAIIRFAGIAPLLGLAGWLLQNFLQLRGIVNLIASRVDLAFLTLCLLGVVYVATVGTAHRIKVRCGLFPLIIISALATDYFVPKPNIRGHETRTNEHEHLAPEKLGIDDTVQVAKTEQTPPTGQRQARQFGPTPPVLDRSVAQRKFSVQLIFKDSPLFTEARKHGINETIDQAYNYLQNVGFAVSVKMPPIGVSDTNVLATSGIYPGTVYDRQIYLPHNSIDDMDEVRKLYLIQVFRTLFHTEKIEEQNDSLIASSLFAVYYASSSAGKDLDHSEWAGRKWTRTLWEIRHAEGKEAADQYMYFTYVRWNDIWIPPGQNFDESFKIRFLAGVWVKANGGDRLNSIMAIINKNLISPQNTAIHATRRELQNALTDLIREGNKVSKRWKDFMASHSNEHLDQRQYAAEAREWHAKIENYLRTIPRGESYVVRLEANEKTGCGGWPQGIDYRVGEDFDRLACDLVSLGDFVGDPELGEA